MAFMVLNEEQIALLTEEQKKQYENELDIYNERTAFVERIKILEDTEIPSYEPKFQYITVIDEIPEKDFDKPEYKMKACNSITKIELNEASFSGVEPICMVLPQHLKRANIEVEHIKKIEATQSELPKVEKIKSTVQLFEQVESKPPILPNVIKMATESFVNFEKTFPDILIEPTNILNINISDMSSISFTEPKVENFILPQVMIAFDSIKGVDKIEQASLKLPNIIKPNVDMEVEKVKPIQAVLPELSNIEVVDVVFDKMKLSNTELPTVLKPIVVDYKRTLAKHSVDNLPVINPFKTELKLFKKPEYKKTQLPVIEIGKLKPELKLFKKPEYKETELPAIRTINDLELDLKPLKKQEHKNTQLPVIEKVNIVDKMFKSVERPKLQTTMIPNLVAPIKIFTKTERKVKELPNKKIINIPDAYAKMAKLLYEK